MLRFVLISLCKFKLLFLACILTATAQSPVSEKVSPETLDELENAQQAAKIKTETLQKQNLALEKDLKKLKDDLIKTAGETAAYEKQAYKIESELKDINRTEKNIKDKLYSDRQALTTLLGSLQSIQTSPPPQFMGAATSPLESVYTHHLMSAISQNLHLKADILGAQLSEIETLEKRTLKQQGKLASTETALSKKRRKIKSLVETKSTLKKSISQQTRQEQARAKKLASEADDLRELITKFESEAKKIAPRVKPESSDPLNQSRQAIRPKLKPPKSKRNVQPTRRANTSPDRSAFAKARGKLRPPVTGTLLKSYGRNHKGISYKTSARAQVTSPYAGRVEFSGPFKNYDNVVILNVGDDYFILMTGLGNIYVDTGDKLKIGEPLGRMPANPVQKSELYMEFRKNGQPVNPKPWLGTRFAQSQ